MTVFQMLKRVKNEEKFADLMRGLSLKSASTEELTIWLKRELTEEELQVIHSAVKKGYPISLDGLQ